MIAHRNAAVDGRVRGVCVDAAEPTLVADRTVGALALVVAACMLCHLLSFDYGRDQGIYAVVAQGLLRGEVPYRDVWDFKPPGIFFTYALARALFGPGMHAVRIVEALGFASLVWAFAIFSRRHLGSSLPGILGGAFAVLAHVQLEFWNTAQPSSFGAIALSWALVCATYEPGAEDPRRRARAGAAWLAAGALYSFAALLKPPLGGGIVVSAVVIASRRWRQAPSEWRRRAVLTPLLLLIAGALVPVLLVVAYFGAVGGLADLYDAVFVFAPQYTALGLRNASVGRLFLRTVGEWIGDFSAVNAIGLVLLLGLPGTTEREREGGLHVFGVIAVLLLGVALQAKFFLYHYSAALALTGLLAGWGFWKLWLRLWPHPLGMAAAGALAVLSLAIQTPTYTSSDVSFWMRCSMRVAAVLNPDVRAATNDRLYSLGEVDPGTNRRVAEWLRAQTPPDATVYVWGFEPIIYDLAERRPASRYVYNVPQRVDWANTRARQQLIADLRARRPAAIVVEHGDRFEWVTGNNLDSAEALNEFPALRMLLAREYRPVGALGSFDLYLRSSQAVRSDATT